MSNNKDITLDESIENLRVAIHEVIIPPMERVMIPIMKAMTKFLNKYIEEHRFRKMVFFISIAILVITLLVGLS